MINLVLPKLLKVLKRLFDSPRAIRQLVYLPVVMLEARGKRFA